MNFGANERESAVTKLDRLLGRQTWNSFGGSTVLDYGCGAGLEAIEVAAAGARFVYGLDVQGHLLQAAREAALRRGVDERCVFLHAIRDRERVEELHGKIACVYTIDAFEHFDEPELVLEDANRFLLPGGQLLISFGPPWKHPRGGHMYFFTGVPWVQLLFAEETVMKVRRIYRSDSAMSYREVEGGLNQMTVSKFLEIVRRSPFLLENFHLIPVKSLDWLVRNPVTREYFTGIIQCRLTKPAHSSEVTSLLSH